MSSNIIQDKSIIDINTLYNNREPDVNEHFNKLIKMLEDDKSYNVISKYVNMANILISKVCDNINKNITNIIIDTKNDNFNKLNNFNKLFNSLNNNKLNDLEKKITTYKNYNKMIDNKIKECNKEVEYNMNLISKKPIIHENKNIIKVPKVVKPNILWSKMEGRLYSEYTRKVDKNKYLKKKTNRNNIQVVDINNYRIKIPMYNIFSKAPCNTISYSSESKTFFMNTNKCVYTLGPVDFIMNIYNNEIYIKGNKLKKTIRCDISRNKCRSNCSYYHDPAVDLKWSHVDRLFTKGYIISLLSMIQDNNSIHKNFSSKKNSNKNRLRDIYQLGGSIIIKAMIIDQSYS